jgi:hypothetical protein
VALDTCGYVRAANTEEIVYTLAIYTADAFTKMPIGYQEGTMRSVDCEGGYATGLEAWFRHADAVKGRVMMAIRLKCSR